MKMSSLRRPNDPNSQVVADSGIPSDRFHLGKIILQSFKDAPNNIMQIDGATGLSETNEKVLRKSVRCAISMKNYGLQCGDVIVIMAPNHLDVAAPLYAALYLGAAIAAVDRTLGVSELRSAIDTTQPKIIFCQNDKTSDVQQVLNDLNLDSLVVTFNKGDSLCTLSQFFERYGGTADTDVERFTPSNFNAEENIGFLISTGGTTGYFKCVAVTHKSAATSLPCVLSGFTDFSTSTKMTLVASPLQWVSAIVQFVLAPILRYTLLLTSDDFTTEHAYHLINTYKPTNLMLSPRLMTRLITQPNRDSCDFTCLEVLLLGGTAASNELVEEIKKVTPATQVSIMHGMTEICCLTFEPNAQPGSCGRPLEILQYRIVNVSTQQDINEPNTPGELWLKGPGVFKEYFNNAEATAEAFTEDRWFKTGDLFYRDENWNYFFVERIKCLINYKNNQISPLDLEHVICQHPGILEVAVTGVPDPECGELPVACVVLRKGSQVTADEIKEMVKKSRSDAHQLRGGVLFLNELPYVNEISTKVNRKKLTEMVLTMDRL